MTELVDLVNVNGEIVERSVPRDDAEHRDGLHLQIVIAVIFNGLGQVLVHERAAIKRVNPGDVDHVCGGLWAGETPEQAAEREAQEEVGVIPNKLRIVRQGINPYNRYCYLMVGETDNNPGTKLDPREVAWAAWHYPDELVEANASGRFTFVDGFFEDIEIALAEQK
jgi:8-oxo-dGTP pyrophosphatase MutT (NUDIX family)